MVETHDQFTHRLTRIGVRHAQMTRDHTTRVRIDGSVITIPTRRASAFPFKMFFGLVLGCLAFKALLLVTLGTVTYNQRLATLEDGTLAERIGAVVLQIDPLTEAMADFAVEVLR
tara:strand:+ start:320 stop:664 length:345 start_codon:yes stop_codon:yes gene_type:complete